MHSEFLQGFLNQVDSYLPIIRSGILVCLQTRNIYGELNTSLRHVIAIKNAALILQLEEVIKITEDLEEKLAVFASLKTPITDEQSRRLLDKLSELEVVIAHLRFNSEDFSIHLTDFVDESFENLVISELAFKTDEKTDESGDEFEIDQEMLEIFGEEAEELVVSINANLRILENNPNDREALLEIRRNAHTLKGSAGIVGLQTLSEVAHRVEDLLDHLAENEIESDEKVFELLSAATECFSLLAGGDASAPLINKIHTLYEAFDLLMAFFKSSAANQAEPVGELISAHNSSEARIPELNLTTAGEFDSRPEQKEEKQSTDYIKTFNEEPTPSNPEVLTLKSVVRVSLEKLDDLVKIISGLVVSRSVFEQRLFEFEQQISELHNSTRRLRQSTQKIETEFETDWQTSQIQNSRSQVPASGLYNLPSAGRSVQPFDSLELDHYTEFHQTIRDLIETTGDTSAINAELDNLKGNLESLFENQRHLIEEMHEKLLRLRMVSFSSLAVRLQRTVRFTAEQEEKLVELDIEGGDLEIDSQILDSLIEPLLHLLRNAVAHGIESPETRRLIGKSETGKIKVCVADEGTHIVLTVSDDGRGISAAALKEKALQDGVISAAAAAAMSEAEVFELIFLAGLTTAEEISQVSGRGVGMNIVKTAVMRQHGAISIESAIHHGTTFTVRLQIPLVVTRALLVRANAQVFALPLSLVNHISQRSALAEQWAKKNNQNQPAAVDSWTIDDLKTAESVRALDEQISSTLHLNQILGFPTETIPVAENTPLLMIKTSDKLYGLLVDEVIKTEEIFIKSLGSPLRQMKEFLGTTILGDGNVVPVLDLNYLLKSKASEQEIDNESEETSTANAESELIARKLKVLIVDDSPSVRHLTSNIIKKAGWNVYVAKDGLEALDILHDMRDLPDVILSDVEMPRMNGYELLLSLNKLENLRSIPVIMITSRSNQKHRQKAVDLGVSEYLTKPFDDAKLIETIKNLTE